MPMVRESPWGKRYATCSSKCLSLRRDGAKASAKDMGTETAVTTTDKYHAKGDKNGGKKKERLFYFKKEK